MSAAGVVPVIIEDHADTEELWTTITRNITGSDLVLADVSSGSPNVAIELGFALRTHPSEKIAIFASKSRSIPSDIAGFVRYPYGSLAQFQQQLIRWLTPWLSRSDLRSLDDLKEPAAQIVFSDHFMDEDLFLRRWWTPPSCAYILSGEGLRFTDATMPLLTTTLGLLEDAEFRFRARIASRNLGWVVKATRRSGLSTYPQFAVMFQLTGDTRICPHILDLESPAQSTLWHVIGDGHPVEVEVSPEGWFEITTIIRGSRIEVRNGYRELLTIDLEAEPYARHYRRYRDGLQGNIGFRCHPGEEAVIQFVEISELS